MASPHVLFVGAGDLARRASRTLLGRGWQVSTVCRSGDAGGLAVNALTGDYTRSDGLAALAGLRPDYLVFTPLPAGRDPSGYHRGFADSVDCIAASGVAAGVRRFFYVSSTRVFAEQDGGWVDEASPLTETDAAARGIIRGEALARALAPATVVRPSGIYGALPGMLLERVRAGVGTGDPDRYSNRIHREDLAAFLCHLLQLADDQRPVPDTVIASDDAPAPLMQVEAWLAERLGVEIHPGTDIGPARANRRCRNIGLHSTGFGLTYPTWREGYAAMLTTLGSGDG